MLPAGISEDSGLKIEHCEKVSGGDINQVFCLVADGKKYFLKVNDALSFPKMFEGEANGLTALAENCSLKIPAVIRFGESASHQYLLLEWLDKSAPRKNFWEELGSGLAKMHQKKQDFFGWHEDNYIGSLPQKNTKTERWGKFYAESRILPLVNHLHEQGSFSSRDIREAETLCKKLDDIFPGEKAALLHGDLWSGNFMSSTKGAAVYDPAVYCGHREMDIGMSKLFGGFDERFYEAYHQTYPLAEGWDQRLPLSQLYPLLVHAILFGGGYVESARKCWKNFI